MMSTVKRAKCYLQEWREAFDGMSRRCSYATKGRNRSRIAYGLSLWRASTAQASET